MTRAFVIGNGPSLTTAQLDLLKDEICFAVNRIHLVYDKTNWRPVYYVRGEETSFHDAKRYHPEIKMHVDMGCNVWANRWYTKFTDVHDKVNIIKSCWHYTNHYSDKDCPHMWHLPRLCSFGSSVNIAVQIAVLEGFKPIYLLGCDLNYEDGEANHMVPEYEEGIEEDLRPARFANLDTLSAHMVAERASKVKIYNCTPKGLLYDLGVYENVKLEDVLNE